MSKLPFGGHDRNMVIDMKLLVGAALFGCGWGLSGICPGPAIASFFGNGPVYYVSAMLMGMGVSAVA